MVGDPRDPIARIGQLEGSLSELEGRLKTLEAFVEEGKVPHQTAILKALLFESLTIEELATTLELDKGDIGPSLVTLAQRGVVSENVAGKLCCYPADTSQNLETSIRMALTVQTHDLDSLASLLHQENDIPALRAMLDDMVERGLVDKNFCGEAADYLYSRKDPRYVDVPWAHFEAMLETAKRKDPDYLRAILTEAGITAEFLEPPAS